MKDKNFVVDLNKKCPYCNHTLETDKFIVMSIIKLREAQTDKEE